MATRKQNVNDWMEEYEEDEAYLAELEARLQKEAEEADTIRDYGRKLAEQSNQNPR